MKGELKTMYIIMLGAPGSGKGTTAKILAKKTNFPHISTGDMFREQIKKETELGKLANSYISQGKFPLKSGQKSNL